VLFHLKKTTRHMVALIWLRINVDCWSLVRVCR